MNLQRLPLTVLAVLVLSASACSDTPTESSLAPSTGNLLIRVTQPCPLVGTVDVFAGNQRLGTLVMPGDTTFSVSAGSHSLSFVRGQETFGSNSLVQVPAGGTAVVTDPPDACMRTRSTP
jgi:hypothetical protein